MAPWPDQPCPYLDCAQRIRDLLAEMISNQDQRTPEFKALLSQTPGGAISCPYCQRAVEYEEGGTFLVQSSRVPLRYSRSKMQLRAADYGDAKSPPDRAMSPEQWIAEEKLMPGALSGYQYAEDVTS
jgi:hypothetical protein